MRISDWSSDVCSSDLLIGDYPLLTCRRGWTGLDPGPKHASLLRFARNHGRGEGDAIRTACVKYDPRIKLKSSCSNNCSPSPEIGRASCRARVCHYVYISVVDGSLKTQHLNKHIHIYHKTQNYQI